MDVTANGFITKMLDRIVKKREQEHVKFYSTQDYQILFADAGLHYVAAKRIMLLLWTHIGEKHGSV
jgi:hypothetical protein